MARSKSWSSAIFNSAILSGVDYVYLPLSTPGALTEELVVERIVGEFVLNVPSGADGMYVYDNVQLGIVVLPTEMIVQPAIPPVVQPFIDSDLEWIWSRYFGEQWSILSGVPTNHGAIHIPVDTGARRRMNPSSETLWAVIVNGSPLSLQWSAGFRWLGSWA